MLRRFMIVLMAACVLTVASGPLSLAQEFYYDLDTTYAVIPSASKIGVQFDTTQTIRAQGEFFVAHPCLDASVVATYLDRGFWIYGLQPSYGYEASAVELRADPAVHRVAPIYITPADSAEFKVSDLVDVQFDLDLSRDAALALLAAHGLRLVDSSEYKHNLWECALDDTITESPLVYGNALHPAPGGNNQNLMIQLLTD